MSTAFTRSAIEVGRTTVNPPTSFLWEPEAAALIELTHLTEQDFLVRVSKSYRLLKQDKEGQENWDRNLRKMNDYLSEVFPSFRLSVDYVNETSQSVIGIHGEVEGIRDRTADLLVRRNQLETEAHRLRTAADHSLDKFEDRLQVRLEETLDQLELTRADLEHITEQLAQKKAELGEWQRNGVMVSYLFTFSTDPEIVDEVELDTVIENHLNDAFNYHRRKVKQVLQGSNFRLLLEEADSPRVLNRVEHTSILNPTALERLIEEYPHLESELAELRNEAAKQYVAFGLKDLEVGTHVFERSKATPARAVNSILQGLESAGIAPMTDVPNTGPMISRSH